MKRQATLAHKFVSLIPEKLEGGTLYVSLEYATALHRCCCGCGKEVVTPLSPTDWQLTFDGVSVSLFPSIGNWGFECRSHYWIDHGRVKWAEQWSDEEISAGRARDRRNKDLYFSEGDVSTRAGVKKGVEKPQSQKTRGGFLSRFANWLLRR